MKERVLGAVILVVLIVLVVPALLSGPKDPAPAPAAAPAAEPGASRSVEIELGAPRPGAEVEILEDAAPATSAASAPPAVREPPTGVPGAVARSAADEPAPVVSAPPRPAPAPSAAVATTDHAAGWAVQVAALANRDAAQQRVAVLQGRGYRAFLLEYRSDGRVLYRVRVGPENSRERAAELAARLQADRVEGIVVSHP